MKISAVIEFLQSIQRLNGDLNIPPRTGFLLQNLETRTAEVVVCGVDDGTSLEAFVNQRGGIVSDTSRTYTVTQTREVKVHAGDPLEAVQIGDAAFNGEINEGDLAAGKIVKPVRSRAIDATEDY